MERSSFGRTAAGRRVDLYSCVNDQGMKLDLANYGATVVSLEVPDRDGNPGNVVLCPGSLPALERQGAFLGATIGRYANRIAGGRFQLDDKEYRLACNNGPNHLHGGPGGFDRRFWAAEPVRDDNRVGVRFSRLSPDGEECYPGNLEVRVTYCLSRKNELHIEFAARCDSPTIINLCHHGYWNLSAGLSETILDHRLTIDADQYLDVDRNMIPTRTRDVEGTVMDFRVPHAIGERIAALKEDPNGTQGYDHNYILRGGDELRPVAQVEEPLSGRVMEVLTTEPGMQLYTGNFLDGSEASAGFGQHAGFCLETQHFPDSPNRPDFPPVQLDPGQRYSSTTVYRFGINGE